MRKSKLFDFLPTPVTSGDKWIEGQQREYLGMLKKKEAKKKALPVATMTLRGIGQMDNKARYELTVWLFNQINSIWEHGPNYAKVFTARYEK